MAQVATGAASLAEQAYGAVRDMIVSLELRPGAVVSERELMERLQIGRTPVREALHRLAQEKFVEVYPRRGMFVTTVEIHDLEPRARVDKFTGLSVDYAERIGAKVLIRSLRAVTDFDYELQMAQMNKQMSPGVETVFMFSNPRLFFSSSHLIKEVAGYGKRLPELVPELVIERLRAKLKVR